MGFDIFFKAFTIRFFLAAKNFATSLEIVKDEAIVDVYMGMNRYPRRIIPLQVCPLWCIIIRRRLYIARSTISGNAKAFSSRMGNEYRPALFLLNQLNSISSEGR